MNRFLLGAGLALSVLSPLSAQPQPIQHDKLFEFEPPVPRTLDGGVPTKPADFLKKKPTDYPSHMVSNGNRLLGWVNCELRIDAAGKLVSVRVTEATHPGFVSATMTSIAGSTYVAAQIEGVPVESTFGTRYVYGAEDRFRRIIPDLGGRVPGKIPGLPAQFDYDAPPLLKHFCEPAYPFELLTGDVKGEAAVRVVLDETGRVATGEVLSATHPEFGRYLLAAMETWRFLPALRVGKATATVIDHQHKFIPSAYRRPGVETQMLKELEKGGKKFVGPAALPTPLALIYRVEAGYPKALARKKVAGEAVIEFVVAPNGQAVLPRVVSATRPEFGLAAATAVQQWNYLPPALPEKISGVLTRETITFNPPQK